MKLEILKYLMEHYGVTENKAMDLIRTHLPEVMTAIAMASRPYYPAGQIADKEAISHLEPCPACDAESQAALGDEQ